MGFGHPNSGPCHCISKTLHTLHTFLPVCSFKSETKEDWGVWLCCIPSLALLINYTHPCVYVKSSLSRVDGTCYDDGIWEVEARGSEVWCLNIIAETPLPSPVLLWPLACAPLFPDPLNPGIPKPLGPILFISLLFMQLALSKTFGDFCTQCPHQ